MCRENIHVFGMFLLSGRSSGLEDGQYLAIDGRSVTLDYAETLDRRGGGGGGGGRPHDEKRVRTDWLCEVTSPRDASTRPSLSSATCVSPMTSFAIRLPC